MIELIQIPPVVAIDFDGKIVESEFPDIGDFKDYAPTALKNIKKAGWIMVLNTCRDGKYLRKACKFLKNNNIHFDYYNENVPSRIQMFNNDCRKIGADVYIDDRHIFGGNATWKDIEEKLLSLYDKRNQ